jgi:hypothetical protein
MDISSLPKDLLPQTDLSYGIGGVEFFSLTSLAQEQRGYEASDWDKNWLVVARDTACGDPIFIDQSLDGLPVYTAMHGMGSWQPSLVASSWAQFLAALELVRPYTRGREHPVGLEKSPLSPEEQQVLQNELHSILGSPIANFWDLLLAAGEP